MEYRKIIDKYYKDSPKLLDILLTHSEQVAKKALMIAKLHPELNLDEDFLFSASMLHDIGIIKTNAPSIECFGKEPYICHGLLGAKMLLKEGWPLHARVCERHTGTGLTKEEIIERSLPLPPKDFIPETLEEQVICYSDKFYSKSKLAEEKSLFKVEKSIAKYGEEGLKRFLKWNQIFG